MIVLILFLLLPNTSNTLSLQKWEDNSLVKLGNSLGRGRVEDCWVCHSHPQGDTHLPPRAVFAKAPLPDTTSSEVYATPFMLATPLWDTLSISTPCFFSGEYSHMSSMATEQVKTPVEGGLVKVSAGHLICTTCIDTRSDKCLWNFTSASCTSCSREHFLLAPMIVLPPLLL